MSYQIQKIRLNLTIILFSLLSACSDVPKKWDPMAYTVKQGDTLYSIAWRYEKDFRQVAQLNNIQAPYAIYPGQRLRMQAADKDGTITEELRPQVLTEPVTGKTLVIEKPQDIVSGTPVKPKARPTSVRVRKDDTLYAIARREGYSHHQLARWNHLRSPYPLKPGQTLRLTPPATSLGRSPDGPEAIASVKPITQPLSRRTIKSTPLVAAPVKAKALPVSVDKWNWPAKGRIVQTFKRNDTSRKGIGITGRTGQTIKAAAAGTVVYSGNGLINYGNLIIIKHSHSFLSAYAYNQSLLVKEGDSVKRGQTIAKMGKLNSKPRLHFEIRRNGKPVNPLNYLPKS